MPAFCEAVCGVGSEYFRGCLNTAAPEGGFRRWVWPSLRFCGCSRTIAVDPETAATDSPGDARSGPVDRNNSDLVWERQELVWQQPQMVGRGTRRPLALPGLHDTMTFFAAHEVQAALGSAWRPSGLGVQGLGARVQGRGRDI